jgi:hypothetical protein
LLVAWEDPAGKPVPLLVLRAGPDEREELLSSGHPFFVLALLFAIVTATPSTAR